MFYYSWYLLFLSVMELFLIFLFDFIDRIIYKGSMMYVYLVLYFSRLIVALCILLIFQPHRTLWRKYGKEHIPKGHGPGTEQKGREGMSFRV